MIVGNEDFALYLFANVHCIIYCMIRDRAGEREISQSTNWVANWQIVKILGWRGLLGD